MAAKEKKASVPRPSRVKLDSLAGIRGEMARVYRDVVNRKLDSGEGTRYVYILKEIRTAFEAETLTDVQARLAALSAQVGMRNG